MARPFRIGVQLPEIERRVGWSELSVMARTAEAVGFDSLWVGDHLLYDLPDGSVRGPWEVWTSLAALAALTQRVAIGPLVASVGFSEPAVLAKKAATIDAISGGRLIVGLGAGWNEREYRAFGLPFDHRVARFEEAFGIIRRLLMGETVDHSGRFYALERCVIDPPPSRAGGPPLMVGSIGPLVDVLVVTFHGGKEGAAAIRTGVGPEFLGKEPRGNLRKFARRPGLQRWRPRWSGAQSPAGARGAR